MQRPENGEGGEQPPEILNPLRLELRESPEAGRGLFAATDILQVGTLLERSPVLVLTQEEWAKGNLDGGVLGGYAFCWPQQSMAVCLGLGSMFNHSASPNVTYLRFYPNSKRPDIRPTIEFSTVRPVRAGEELTICYSADESKLWFSPSYVSTRENAGASSNREGGESPAVNQCSGNDSDGLDWMGSLSTSGLPEENALAGPSRLPMINGRSEEEVRAKSDQTGGEIEDKETAQKPRRELKRLQKHKKWEEKMSKRGVDMAGDAVASPSLALVNGSSETGSDRTSHATNPQTKDIEPRPHSPSVELFDPETDPAYRTALDALDLVPMLELLDVDVRLESQLAAKRVSHETSQSEEGCWDLVKRIKGPIEDSQMEDHRQIQIWVLAVEDSRILQVALDFIRKHQLDSEELRHLKRVFRHQRDNVVINSIVLCSVDDAEEGSLRDDLRSFSPQLADVRLELRMVPASPARTMEELARKALVWPVSYSQRRPNPSDSPWTIERKAWARKGIERIVKDAIEAKARGELPVAVHVTCPPPAASVAEHGDIPPTPNFRASAIDTRISTAHPLRHASLNCIAKIAHLRTVPPFSSVQQKRNGADYLLTSLSLFITHEPCLMCTMALIHSRVKEVFYILPSPDGGGGFGSTFGVHGYPGVNHRVDVFECRGLISSAQEEALRLVEGTNI